MYGILATSRCTLASEPISERFLIDTFADIKVLPFKILIYETEAAAKHLNSHFKTLPLYSGGVMNKTHPLETAEHFSLYVKTLRRDSGGVVDHRLIPETLGSKWEYSLNGVPVHLRV